MNSRPVLFRAEDVRAILDGRKNRIRRVIEPQPDEQLFFAESNGFSAWVSPSLNLDEGAMRCCPYGIPGNKLWIRETWAAVWPDLDEVPLEECTIEYRADLPVGCTDYPGEWPAEEALGNTDAPKWRASIHMPRLVSRITLTVTDVQVEQVTEAGVDDAGKAYGVGAWLWVVAFTVRKQIRS